MLNQSNSMSSWYTCVFALELDSWGVLLEAADIAEPETVVVADVEAVEEPWFWASEFVDDAVRSVFEFWFPCWGLLTYSLCEVSSPFRFLRQTGQVPCFI